MKFASMIFTVVFGLFGLAHAQSGAMKGMDMKDMDMKKDSKSAAMTHKATGKVTKVDRAAGTVTIAHGPVASMKWPAMTMSFKSQDKKMLEKLKAGDQVQFAFTESGKDHLITEIK